MTALHHAFVQALASEPDDDYGVNGNRVEAPPPWGAYVHPDDEDDDRPVPQPPPGTSRFGPGFDPTALPDEEACHRALAEIDVEIASIQGQLEAVRKDGMVRAPGWAGRARVALRAKQALRNAIDIRRKILVAKLHEERRHAERLARAVAKPPEQIAAEREAVAAKERRGREQREHAERALAAKADRQERFAAAIEGRREFTDALVKQMAGNRYRRLARLAKLLRARDQGLSDELWAEVDEQIPEVRYPWEGKA